MKYTPERRLKDAVKYVSRQWGHGWPRLGVTLQQALVRGEVLAEINRFHIPGADPASVNALTENLASLAMQWSPE